MGSLLSSSDSVKLNKFYKTVQKDLKRFIGYPANMQMDYSELYKFQKFFLNNIGDPFVVDQYAPYRHQLEKEVLLFFSDLLHAGKDFWGYVTTGGTEGNLYGLYLARETYPQGIVYYSSDAHYSIPKSVRILRMDHRMVASQPHGEIDYAELEQAIRSNRSRAPIILATIGTTMKGGNDQIQQIHVIMKKLEIHEYYIHCDAALNGMVLPFIKGSVPFDFSAGAHSIAISGHKLIGSPIACGVFLGKKSYVDRLSESIEYARTVDNTLVSSRSGLASLILWYAIRLNGIKGYRRIIGECLDNAEYAVKKLQQIGIAAWRNKHSFIVVFPCTSKTVIEKWHLAPQGELVHIVTMPHVTKDLIDDLIKDLKKR